MDRASSSVGITITQINKMAELTDAFIDFAAADGLALFYVGVPEDAMILELYALEAELENGLQPLGAGPAAELAETFCAVVIRRRREIEAGGSMPPAVLN
jgi:hypothetical protein